ncbi:unnamed protein product [Urochloa humidicola]
MPPARRPRVSSRAPPSSSAAAADPRRGRGLLSALRRDPTKQPHRADDDGTPLTDELLLVIFAGVPDLADLVRCAATCRRWRRLVSADAAFICRTPRRLGGRPAGSSSTSPSASSTAGRTPQLLPPCRGSFQWLPRRAASPASFSSRSRRL